MIILVGGMKGGTSKSTVATNLAAWFRAQGADIIVIDGNSRQGTMTKWIQRREQNDELDNILCVPKTGNIKSTISELNNKYDIVLIDTGGQDSKEFRTALLAAELLITPVGTSIADIETIVELSEMIDEARETNPNLITKILISDAETNPAITLTEETREILAEFESFEVLSTVLHHRVPYKRALVPGAGVTEMLDSSWKKASQEINALTEELFNG